MRIYAVIPLLCCCISYADTPSIEKRRAYAAELANISAARPSIKSHNLALEWVQEIHFQIFDTVKAICREEKIPKDSCTWSLSIAKEPGFEAYAHRKNEIVIHSGLINKIAFKDELAFVIAHEVSHHLFDHVARTRNGVFIGAILGAVTGIGVDTGVSAALVLTQAQSAGLEQQADAMAALILNESGFDTVKSRNVLIRLAKMDGRSKTRLLQSHPAGFERLISFDQNIEGLRQ